MSGASRRPFPLLLLLVALLAAACGAQPPLPADPGVVRFDPAHTTTTVELGNPGPGAKTVTGLRIEGDDWIAFQIVNEDNPDRIGPGSTVQVELRVDPRALRTDLPAAGAPAEQQESYASFRTGTAELRFELDGEAGAVPLRFDPGPTGTTLASLVSALLAALALAAGAALARGRGAVAKLELQPGLVLALATLAIAWCTLPIADAVCTGDLAAPVGELGRARCRAGLGGAPAAALPGPFIGLAAVLALALAPLLGARRGLATRDLPRVLAALTLGLAVAITTLSDPAPILLVVPALLGARAIVLARDGQPPSWLDLGWDLLASALLVIVVLEALPIPTPDALPHGAVLAIRALAIGALAGATALGIGTLRGRDEGSNELPRRARTIGRLSVVAAAWLALLVAARALELTSLVLGGG